MIDTHCHLTFPDFSGAIEATLAEAEAAGVTGCITISTTSQDCVSALEIARRHSRVWCSAGVHPGYSDQGPHDWETIRRVGSDPKCVAWGELGLDNHYPEPARDVQRLVLEEQLAYIQKWRKGDGTAGAASGGAASPNVNEDGIVLLGKVPSRPPHRHSPSLETPPPLGAGGGGGINKPIVIHCREAFDDLIPVLRGTSLDLERLVFHCFTGTPADMRKLLDIGAMVSFTGVVTYRTAKDVRDAAKLAPLERIMVETDAPFLSPEPKRSARPCKPAYSRLTAEALADLRGESWRRFHDAINENTQRFFGIDAR